MSASTTLLTDAATMIANGPTAATAAAAAGTTNGIDYIGTLYQVQARLKELKVVYNALISVTNGSDPNLTILNNDLLTIS